MLLQGERSLAASELWVGRLQSVKDKRRNVETGSLFFLSWAGFFRPLSGLYWGCLSGEVSWNQIDSHLDGCDIICLLQSYWTVVTNWGHSRTSRSVPSRAGGVGVLGLVWIHFLMLWFNFVFGEIKIKRESVGSVTCPSWHLPKGKLNQIFLVTWDN